MGEFTIEPLPSDMESKYRDFLREYDFSPGDENIFKWYRNLIGTTMYISLDNGRIIASGMSFSMGKTGWLGAICTHEDYRGMGLGRAMTQMTIDRLRGQGAEHILLRASEEGAKLYRRMGFRDSGSYENFMVDPADFKFQTGKNIRPITTLSTRHFELDSLYTGENREQILHSLPVSRGYELSRNGALQAFVYPSIGNGVMGMSTDTELIPVMLEKIMAGRSGKIRTLKGTELNRYMHERGFRTKDGARRMVLGEDPIKNKNGIIGTISSSIG